MNSELFEFPFISGVWGTVSDWVMVMVTAITAYLLFRTLREQQNFNRIELERYSRENPPTFRLVGGMSAREFPLRLTARLTRNRLVHLSIRQELPDFFIVEGADTLRRTMSPRDDINFIIYTEYGYDAPRGWRGDIIFEYGDRMGNHYNQILKVERSGNYFTEPILIT